jgi:hypothetical protein
LHDEIAIGLFLLSIFFYFVDRVPYYTCRYKRQCTRTGNIFSRATPERHETSEKVGIGAYGV